MSETSARQSMHDLRGSLHVIEMSILALQYDCSDSDKEKVVSTIRSELSKAKKQLEELDSQLAQQ